MNIKKVISSVLVSAIAITALSTTAFAHGHGGRHHNGSYSVCNVQDCDLTYNHQHNGVNYYGHHTNDGHGHYYY